MNESITTVAVIGAGTMGSGIAFAAARAGLRTILFDVDRSIAERGIARIASELDAGIAKGKIQPSEKESILASIEAASDYASLAPAQLVIEAAPEKIDLKKSIFQALANVCSDSAILATNTSSLSVTAIASSTKNSARVVGMHFFNPAHVMKLVEIVQSAFTSEETMQATIEIAARMGKTTVRVKDTPAFIVNRVARPFYGEAFRLLDQHVASVEAIDAIARAHGFRMGPFELMDLIGIDVNFDVTSAVFEMFFGDSRYRPHPIQKQMVDAGLLGRKSGRGFYDYNKKKE